MKVSILIPDYNAAAFRPMVMEDYKDRGTLKDLRKYEIQNQ